MNNHLCPGQGRKNQTPVNVDQAPKMEYHLRRDKGRLLEVYDKPEPEVTTENEVTSVGLSMNYVIDVRIHEKSGSG